MLANPVRERWLSSADDFDVLSQLSQRLLQAGLVEPMDLELVVQGECPEDAPVFQPELSQLQVALEVMSLGNSWHYWLYRKGLSSWNNVIRVD